MVLFFILDAFSFYPAMGTGFGAATSKANYNSPPNTIEIPVHDNYKFYLETGALPGIYKISRRQYRFLEGSDAHPNYDAWWKARDARNATKNLKPAMLWVGGLFDAEDNWGAWNAYKAAEAK